MSDESVAHLREYLLARLEALRQVWEERHTAHERASEIQTAEIARRMDTLNHEAQRLLTLVPREVFEDRCKALDLAIKELSLRIEPLLEFRANILGRQAIIAIGVSIIVSLAVALLVKVL